MSQFRGTTLEQDGRWNDKQQKHLASMKFPKIFETKVDISKVQMAVIKQWIIKRVMELTANDDDVIPNYIISMLEEKVRLVLNL
jgi:serine/arginine repetitive matrix protein 1